MMALPAKGEGRTSQARLHDKFPQGLKFHKNIGHPQSRLLVRLKITNILCEVLLYTPTTLLLNHALGGYPSHKTTLIF